ncbi:MAG: UpxY family transcription antiterminator [Lewinellaceae bacterium]|nr:UpxY family transcription antiterminator [Lewinellaceae bacterium]
MNAVDFKENHLDDIVPRWFAVYTRYKREKVVLERLQEKGIQTYLPVQRLTRRYDRKVREVELPLINCYIFTRITRKNYVQVLDTPDVLHFVRFSNNLIAIPEKEILLLQRVTGGQEDLEIEQHDGCRVGDEVEIVGGRLTGVKGILVEKRGKGNFLIELRNIGFSLRLQVDPSLLRRMGMRNR